MPKTLRPQKRSVSPFGARPPVKGPFDDLKRTFGSVLGQPTSPAGPLKSWNDAGALPWIMEKVAYAPSNDAPDLEPLCAYLSNQWGRLEEAELSSAAFVGMEIVFKMKTSVFLIDHYDKPYCEKMGWPDEYRDEVLFSKERDAIVGGFFGEVTEKTPGLFSDFIHGWSNDAEPDRSLHFLDFCRGSKRPTFEHFLLFTHPSLKRILMDKKSLKNLFNKAAPLLPTLKSPTYEADLKKAFGL